MSILTTSNLKLRDLFVFVSFCLMIIFSVTLGCASSMWRFLTVHEILFHVTTPFNGVDLQFFSSIYNLSCPIVLGYAFLFLVFKKRRELHYLRYLHIFCACSFILSIGYFIFIHKLNLLTLVFSPKSTFFEEHYVYPEKTKIEFSSRRNLIHIYLESVETTFNDLTLCKNCDSKLIPLLEKTALEGIDFSNSKTTLNGAHDTFAANWTAASIFSQDLGIPLVHQYHKRFVSRRDHFGAQSSLSLPKILRQEGYDLYFLAGSDLKFASKDHLLRDHGNFTTYDYNWFVEQQLEDSSKKIFWGVDDQRTFETAKERLLEISKSTNPFVFNILTVDTHPYGFLPKSCQSQKYPFDLPSSENFKKYGMKKTDKLTDNFYSEVIKCSDKAVSDFIEWLKEQPFYENTTVVITGDHLLQSHFLKVDNDKRRTYVAFLNTAHSDFIESSHREYNLYDLFPTTLSAVGATIEGDRLGLGTNLFSQQQTLTEQYGEKFLHKELSKYSELLNNLLMN